METTGDDAADDAAGDKLGGVTLMAGPSASRRSCSFFVNSLVIELKKLSTLRFVPAVASRAGGTMGVGEEGG